MYRDLLKGGKFTHGSEQRSRVPLELSLPHDCLSSPWIQHPSTRDLLLAVAAVGCGITDSTLRAPSQDLQGTRGTGNVTSGFANQDKGHGWKSAYVSE